MENQNQVKKTLTLHEAIIAIMEECPTLEKALTVGSGSYGYKAVSEKAFIDNLQPLMVKYQLTMVPVGGSMTLHEQYPTDKGKIMNRIGLMLQYRLTHYPSDQHLTIVAFGEGCDQGDKATGKASTNAYKYALRQAFMVATGDDPDKTHSKELERKAQAPKPNTPRNGTVPTDLQDTYRRALKAIHDASTEETLNGIRNHYRHAQGRPWNFTAVQIRDLDAALELRLKAIQVSTKTA